MAPAPIKDKQGVQETVKACVVTSTWTVGSGINAPSFKVDRNRSEDFASKIARLGKRQAKK